MVKPKRMGHLVLNVKDVEASTKFYTELLGFEISRQRPDGSGTFLTCGKNHHDLALFKAPEDAAPVTPGSLGLNYFAVEVEEVDALKEVYHTLQERGVPVERTTDHNMTESVYFHDPDGILIEFFCDSFETTVNYNFEDGVVRGIPSKMQVPPKIITENGNKFMRITGSAGDKGAIPAAATNRNRSLVELTPKPVNMPVITSENRRQTYSVDMRWTDPVPSNACSDVARGRARVVTLQLYQHADGESESYGSHNGIGPAVRFLQYGDGRTAVEHLWNNENASERVPLGRPGNGWHNYKIVAEWQLNGGPGRLEIYYDGVLKKVWSGTNINLGPASNRLPTLSVGLYGDYAVGIVDVDNVKAGPSSGGGSTPPAPVPDAEVVAVNVGGAQYAGADGTVYRNDAWFSGGSTYTTTASIAGTTDDRLYQNDRFGNFSYNIPVANGDYLVTLKFAELYWTEVGRRVFNVSMEGKAVLSHLDLVAKVGPKARYDVTLPVTVTGGVLNIRFQSVVDDATISGIKVAPKSASVSAATNVRVVSGQ